jgi:fused signal recognition particle receptor
MTLEKQQKSFFGRMSRRLSDAIMATPSNDDELLEEIEEILITSDIGMETTEKIVDALREDVRKDRLDTPEKVRERLKEIMISLVDKGKRHELSEEYPMIILMIGINGGGKTTTIGKLPHKLNKQGKTVLLAAADTFRAAAGEQLSIWARKAGVNVIIHREGADPSAVIFDAIMSAKSKGTDVLICDTAGRLQNKKNLMAELSKMDKVIEREFPEASRENLLVLDATTGKNAVSQSREFSSITDITGIVITKLDGTAKGGIALTIADEFDMPIKFVGTGETIEDLQKFVAQEFIGGIFNE